jgi:hypothetical protein
MEAGGEEARPLARIAADLGVSLVTAKRASALGADLLRERVSAADLAATVAASRSGAARSSLPTRTGPT